MVASVGRITAGRGYDYLTREVATSKHDYYTGKGEAPGVWSGRGSALIGLSGPVDAADMAVLYGRFVVPSTAGGTRLASGRWLHEQVLGRKVVAKTRADGSVAEPRDRWARPQPEAQGQPAGQPHGPEREADQHQAGGTPRRPQQGRWRLTLQWQVERAHAIGPRREAGPLGPISRSGGRRSLAG